MGIAMPTASHPTLFDSRICCPGGESLKPSSEGMKLRGQAQAVRTSVMLRVHIPVRKHHPSLKF
jgi:hypothetical protein